MICQWQQFINLLPLRLREQVDKQGSETLQELRLRIGNEPELVAQSGSHWLDDTVTPDDLSFIINAASRYSPWSAATIRRGYITAPGGHRIGLCGDAVMQGGEMSGIRTPISLCMRVARDFPGIAAKAGSYSGSILIIGCPGSGKTTLLRDLIRQRSNKGPGSIAVVDERGELFPTKEQRYCFSPGRRTDVITGCGKEQGIDVLLRTMGPSCIAVDEITAENDCRALMNAGWSGVTLLATAHARNLSDLRSRPIYRPIINSGLFDTLLVMQPDKSWKEERM